MVPLTSIFCITVSMLVSIGFPTGLFLVLRKRLNLKLVPMLVGVAAFVVFAMVLERMLHVVVLRPAADGVIEILNHPLLYVLYACLAAGIFEESGRFISFRLLKSKYTEISTGLSYGIGHGGIEAILLVGLVMINNLVLSIMVNMGATDTLGDAPEILAGVAALQYTDSYLFLMGGFERIASIVVHISLSVLVWISVNKPGKKWLFPAAIVLHAAVNAPVALMQVGVIKSIFLVELVVAASAVIFAALAVFAYKRFGLVAK